MANTVTFTTELLLQGNNTGILVPVEVLEQLDAGRRPPVVVRIGDFEYRSTVASMGGRYLIAFSSDKRKATGLVGGETIEVTLTHDTAERTVDVPEDLAAALAEAGVRERFDTLAFSQRKEHVRAITEAKGAETRARRIAAAVMKLSS